MIHLKLCPQCTLHCDARASKHQLYCKRSYCQQGRKLQNAVGLWMKNDWWLCELSHLFCQMMLLPCCDDQIKSTAEFWKVNTEDKISTTYPELWNPVHEPLCSVSACDNSFTTLMCYSNWTSWTLKKHSPDQNSSMCCFMSYNSSSVVVVFYVL